MRPTTSISAIPKTSGDTEEFLYISNESHYEQVIERIKNVRNTLDALELERKRQKFPLMQTSVARIGAHCKGCRRKEFCGDPIEV